MAKRAVKKDAASKVAARKPAAKKATRRKSASKVSKARVPKTQQAEAPVADAVLKSATSEAHSITTREPARNQLAEDVERFLAQGGEIEEVPRNLRADPPRKPENNYGRGSI